MQVFKVYFKILKKQMVSILIYGALFLGITIMMMGSLIKENTKQFNLEKTRVLVVNNDGQNSFLDGFLKYMEKYVTFEEVENTEEARSDALFYRKVLYIMTIPEGFTKAFLSGEKVSMQKQTIPDSTESLSVDNAINNYFNAATIYRKYSKELNSDELNTYVEQSLDKVSKVSFDVVQENDLVASNSFNNTYFNYLGYIIIICFIIGVSTVMLSFHSVDIRRRLHAAPVTERSTNIQLILANFAFVMCYLLVFLIAGYLCNPYRRVNTNLVLYWINAFFFALTALSLSYLVGISVKSKKAIAAISTALSLSLAFLSGVFVPQEFLGATVLKVASFTPSYWFVRANNAILGLTSFKWDNVAGIFGYMAIQIGFAAAILAIALVVNKRKGQQAY